MKKYSLLLALVFTICGTENVKSQEIGFGLGTSNYFGDLGRQGTTKNYVSDLWIKETRPSVTAYYRHHFNNYVALRGAMTLGFIRADDAMVEYENKFDSEWYRNYRNLHFKSHIFELSAMVEASILPYSPGSLRNRFTPYVTTGLALFHFDPRAKYDGEWVRLQPLGTEGQGMDEYPERRKYSLIQPAIPLGIGVKYNITQRMTLNFEVAHRFTFTDYLDDVSTTYVSKEDFNTNYDSETAQMAYALSVRSQENDIEGVNRNVTRPGQIRGNPAGNDAYVFTTLSVTYYFGRLNNDLAHRDLMRRYRLRW